jgi:hypothetical protein
MDDVVRMKDWKEHHELANLISSLNLDSEEPIEGIDVDDQPTLIVKLPKVCEYARLLTVGRNCLLGLSKEVEVNQWG